MKKKIVIAALAAAMVLGLTACGGAPADTTPVLNTSNTMELKDVSSTGLAGMCEYLKGNGVIGESYIQMNADIIGAKDGRKYVFKFNDTTMLVEVYEFDLKNLSDTGRETLDNVKNNGNFTVLDQVVPAKISESGKYIYTNSNTKTEDPDKTQNEKLERLFQEFDKQESAGKIKVKKEKDEDKEEKTESSEAQSETSSN